MSTIKSSAENLTLNADGANNDVIIQSNGSTKVTLDGANGRVGINTNSHHDTSTKLTVDGRINTSNGTATGSINYGGGSVVNVGALTNHPVNLIINNSTKWLIDTNGNLVAEGGGGIVLGNTSYAAANELNDYEEGTWTPAIKFGGNAASFATSLNVGFYTKIGNFVHWCFRTTITNKGSSTGNCSVAGLPFACASTTGNFGGAHIVFSQNWTADAGMSEEHNQCVIDSGSSSIVLRRIATNGGFNSTTNTQFTNSTQIIMKGEYRVS